jgi:anhydro-N-acetylmuramic acid kinase
MSGTSLDGADGVLAQLGPQGQWLGTLAHAHRALPPSLHEQLLALNTPGDNELHRAALAGIALSRLYADMVADLHALAPGQTACAIGAHGQTVRHRPDLGYTLQLLNPALLAELTHTDVVADFRSRDVAAGGQGAPLVPVFHQAVFAQPTHAVAVLNMGGMANVSLLVPGCTPQGFDCGPGNVLMDLWCQLHRGQSYDAEGAWAQQGQVQSTWLQHAMAEPFFALPPPKSTGRDLFHSEWLNKWLVACGLDALALTPQQQTDVQATLCELTAHSAAQAIAQSCPHAAEVLVCGGGALNRHLMARLTEQLHQLLGTPVLVRPTDQRGIPAMQVEAAAFAWLAWACVHKRAGNVPAVTGAHGERTLGAVYQGVAQVYPDNEPSLGRLAHTTGIEPHA